MTLKSLLWCAWVGTAVSASVIESTLRRRSPRHLKKKQEDHDIVTVLVKAKNAMGMSAITHDAKKVIHTYNKFGIMAVEVPRSHLDILQKNSDIEYLNIDREIQFINPIDDKTPAVRRHRKLAQDIPWGITKVLEGANIQPGSRADEIKVCVIDTGYDLGHPDLPDATGTSTDSGIWNVDGHGHGTHCAGTIAALNNDEGVVGVIGNGNGITIHIGKGLTDSGTGTFEAVMAAFEGCVDAGADVVSMSLGCSGEEDCYVQAFDDMVTQAYNDYDVLTIAAAGNDGNTDLSFPASFKAAMSVAAMDDNEDLASFSQRNHQVEIAGPGVSVESTWKNGGYNTISGTSMATPHVSGVAALLWSYNPDCTAKQIRKILLASARPLGQKNCTTDYGYGVVQAKAAIAMLTERGCDAGENARPDVLNSEDLYAGCRLAVGEECGSDGECISDICIYDICRSQRLGDYETCEENDDCINGSCALGAYEQDAAMMCCSRGGIVELDVPWSYYDQRFCMGLATGSECGDDVMCASAMCIHGVCSDARLNDTESCGKDSDCVNATCAKKMYAQSAELVCCEGGGHIELDVSWSYSDEQFCRGLETGEACGSNAMCASNICIFSTCRDARLGDIEACEEDGDCSNRLCARKTYREDAELVCCHDGGHVELDVPWSYSDQLFCAGLPIGEECGSNSMCAGGICIAGSCTDERLNDSELCDEDGDCIGGSCARESYEQDAVLVCCRGGGHVELDVPWSWSDEEFCTGLPSGEACGRDDMCSSNICIFSRCQEDRLNDTEACEEDSDCVNRSCARGSYEEDAGLVCCKGGSHTEVDVPWSWSDEQFCTGLLSKGESCGSNDMCGSNICVLGQCQKNRIGDTGACEEDADCVNGSCAHETYEEGASLVCCRGGGHVELDVTWSWRDEQFCTGLPTGEACGRDDMCSSNICISSRCEDNRLGETEACEEDSDCENMSCARGSFLDGAGLVCCRGGGRIELDVPWSWYDDVFCTGLETGKACGSDSMCASNKCSSEICA